MLKVFSKLVNVIDSLQQLEPNPEDLEIAIVDKPVFPVLGGRVRYQGSIWPARSLKDLTFDAGEIVRVIGRTGITLLIERRC